jgi:hypothetical protein
MNATSKNQRGSVTIIVLAVILLILLGLIALKLTDKATNKPGENEQTTQSSDQTNNEKDSSTDTSSSSNDSGLGALQRNSRNVVRKNDASRLASATLEYVSNNVGLMPTDFDKGYLTGGSSPSQVQFDHYDTTRIEIGDHAAVTNDEIILVTGGSCGQDGAAIESTSRSAAVLFATEGDGGRWDGVCQDL